MWKILLLGETMEEKYYKGLGIDVKTILTWILKADIHVINWMGFSSKQIFIYFSNLTSKNSLFFTVDPNIIFDFVLI